MTNYSELVKAAIRKAHEDAAAAAQVQKTIAKRTAKTVIVRKNGKEQRNKITVINGRETIYPWGVYSMCPVISAE